MACFFTIRLKEYHSGTMFNSNLSLVNEDNLWFVFGFGSLGFSPLYGFLLSRVNGFEYISEV